MAKKKQKTVAEVSRVTLANGTVIIRFEDGTMQIIPATILVSAEEAEELYPTDGDSEDEDEEDEDEEEEDDDEEDSEDEEEDSEEEEEEEEEEELTPEQLADMDFEQLQDLCDDNDLEADPDEYEEEDVEDLRKAVAKELNIKLPAKKEKPKKSKKK